MRWRPSLDRESLHGRLADRRLVAWLPWLAVLLCLPALWLGWQADDHFQRVVLSGRGLGISPSQVFSVLTGDPEANRLYVEWGTLPWWTADGFRLAFERSLTVFTMWLDYQLWPRSAPLMHLHSLLWYALVVCLAARLFRRLSAPAWAAGLAALVFALDDSHAVPAAWLANRNALVAAAFGFGCLLAHDLARRDGRRWAAWTSPLLLALALAGGEAGVATGGYLLAHALFVDPARPRRALAALAPHAAVVVAWAGWYRWRGLGASGSGLYLDPVADPAAFAGAWVERAPFLLLGQWTAVPADVGSLAPPSAVPGLWLFALVVLLPLAAVLVPVVRRRPAARLWALGSLLSTVPIVATFPSNRLLLFVSLGGAALLAELAADLVSGEGTARRRRAARVALWILLPMHLVLAPLAKPLGALSTRVLGQPMVSAIDSLPRDAAFAEQTLVVVNAPDFLLFVSNVPTLRMLDQGPPPRRVRALSTGPTAVRLTRVDRHALEVELADGLFRGPLGRLFRGAGQPLSRGDVVELPDLQVRVAEDSDGEPVRLVYRFDRELEDPSLCFVRWSDGRYARWTPPPVGATEELPPARGPFERMVETLGAGRSL